MTLTRLEIASVFRRIVQTWPLSDRMLKTFTIIRDGSFFDNKSVTRSYEDAINGRFWSLGWAQNGQDPSGLTVEHGILGIEFTGIELPKPGSKSGTRSVWIVLADTTDMPTPVAPSELEDLLEDWAICVMQEMRKYNLYIMSKAGEDDWRQFATQEEVDHLISESIIDSAFLEDQFDAFLQENKVKVQGMDPEMVGGLRAVTFELKFDQCGYVEKTFDYTRSFQATKGVTKCKTC